MKGYVAFGIIVCTLFYAAGIRGMALFGLRHGKAGPYGHSVSHK